MLRHLRISLISAAAILCALTVALTTQPGDSDAASESPTPTVSASPTPTASASLSPTPTPVPKSTITIRFVQAGEPVEVMIGAIHLSADGVLCPILRPDEVVARSKHVEGWPLDADEFPTECRKGPPTSLTFTFFALTPDLDDSLFLTGEVIWTGVDVTKDIDVPPGFALPATATPTMTPAEFPSTGGESADADSDVLTIRLAFAVTVATGLLVLTAAAVGRPALRTDEEESNGPP